MELGMVVMRMRNNLNCNFKFTTIGKKKMADEEICEVGSKIVPRVVKSNDAWLLILVAMVTLITLATTLAFVIMLTMYTLENISYRPQPPALCDLHSGLG
jgi:hypothetical protein